MTKRRTANFLALVCSLALFMVLTSCGDSEVDDEVPGENIIPERFGVDIPASLTEESTPGGRTSSPFSAERLLDDDGSDIYELLTFFIHLGERSSNLAEAIIGSIYELQLTSVTSFTYTSDDDGREKFAAIVEGTSYGGTNYEYGLFISDVASEGNDDGGIAMRVYWDRAPLKGVAVLVPYNIDRQETPEDDGTVYSIEYDESGSEGYDAHMVVSIAAFPLGDPEEDPFAVDNLRMFVGRSGDVLDIYGNSNHPNARFFTDDQGFNWAFVASGFRDQDFGVAEVGLPPSNLNSTSRTELLDDYSIRAVFLSQIQEAFPQVPSDALDTLVTGAEAPGFFGESGFIQGGTSPGTDWDALTERIEGLTPYNPSEISTLVIDLN